MFVVAAESVQLLVFELLGEAVCLYQHILATCWNVIYAHAVYTRYLLCCLASLRSLYLFSNPFTQHMSNFSLLLKLF